MPELPEVETVKNTLLLRLINKKIVSVQVIYDKMIINNTASSFQEKLKGQIFTNILRRGKYLIFILTDWKLISHLRMEGKYFIKNQSEPLSKHEHIVFTFEDGETLRYHDVRKFGTMELLKPHETSLSGLSMLGYEPFDKEFTSKYLFNKLTHSSRPIKIALLDQSVVSGLGNIYVDEVLFLSKIHPSKPCEKITESDSLRIVKNAIAVLKKAIELGGASVHSFSYGDGITGRFQNSLLVHTHANEPCKVCNTVIEKTKVGGRGTYYCPKCQKL